ncbi:hypothetical protein JAAARDRAFT_30211 [Jaapia argillacea MUCL 33604]|uniref:Chromatin modification-related protein EAF7 n=1 Tax=Jaapia argillacea MUCL 33604 TaxID=933084 RepID=A0A067Q5P2_9AGAM|nr:hypothetical protein JAAARDRAFT_30211 [Jaapia argillacea MUCL 33604]
MTIQTNESFLDTVEGEVSFFHSLMKSRPVGIHRYFHVITMRNAIFHETNRWVDPDDIWAKLRSCYDLDALEGLVRSIETEGYDSPTSNQSAGPLRSPSPSENLSGHPFFRQEFILPQDDSFDAMIAARRMRAGSLPASSPAQSPAPVVVSSRRTSGAGISGKGRGKKRTRSGRTVSMAGLVEGSDSSALTEESGGEESVAPTPRESVMTGTDAGTDIVDEEDVEVQESPGGPAKPTRNRAPSKKKGKGRTSTSRPTKKRKR